MVRLATEECLVAEAEELWWMGSKEGNGNSGEDGGGGQEEAARSSKQSADSSGDFGAPIVTEISPAGTFWRAEDYHQQFIAKRRQKFGGLFR